jgi:hypothetical protein
MSSKRRKSKLPPFVPMIKTTMATPAWRAMSFGARLLYIELRGHLRNDYLNNGTVWLSCRDAAKAIGVTPGSHAGTWKTSISGSCAKRAKDFSVLTAAGSPRAIASRSSGARGSHQPVTSKNGMANCSSIPPAGPVAKNRTPCHQTTHPVSPNDTYVECALDSGQFQAAVLTGCWAWRSSYCAGLR